MPEYLDIKNKIKEKLEAIEKIKIVHSYEKANLGGFPAVVILGFTANDILEDTVTNLREYTFKVRVFQELASTDPEKAEEIIDNLIDILMDVFGQDFTLGGTCEGCWVKSGLGWVDREVGMRVYDMEILAKKLISFIPGEVPPVPIPEYQSFVKKVATIENIDFKIVGETSFYIVPSGLKFIPLGVIVRIASIENPNGDSAFRLRNVEKNALFCSGSNASMGDPDRFTIQFSAYASDTDAPICNSGEHIEFSVYGAETGDIFVADIDLIGYLIKE